MKRVNKREQGKHVNSTRTFVKGRENMRGSVVENIHKQKFM